MHNLVCSSHPPFHNILLLKYTLHTSSSYCTLHPVSNRKLIDISDAWAKPGTMCSRVAFYGMSAMSRLHACVYLSFYSYGILMEIYFLSGCIFFTGVPGSTKCPVAPVSAMSYCLDICIIDVEYYVYIYLLVLLLMMIVCHHRNHWLLVVQIYLWYCVWWGKTS